MNEKINLAIEDYEIQNCYPVMAELRPHVQAEDFLRRVKRQSEIAGYKLAYLTDGEIKVVAGFRISEWLAAGKYLCIEDWWRKAESNQKVTAANYSSG